MHDLLRQSGVVLPAQVDLEISHHYGIDRFDEFGLTMLTAVNRGYCKKILVLLPGQNHPEQHHKTKEESFHVLYGDVWINLDGQVRNCKPGDVVVVEPGARHSFGTKGGAGPGGSLLDALDRGLLLHRSGDHGERTSQESVEVLAGLKRNRSQVGDWLIFRPFLGRKMCLSPSAAVGTQ